MSFASLTVVLAGAIVLAAEAIQQFRKPSQHVSTDRFSILRGVQIDSISTLGERARGATLYVLIYLVLYAVLIGSDELYRIFSDASGDRVGPSGIDFLADDPGNGQGLAVDKDLARPFYIATAIMVAMVSGILAPVERAIRNVAHRAANIPNGVFRIVDGLETFDLGNPDVQAALEQEGGQLVALLDLKIPKGDKWHLPDTAREDLRSYLAQIDLLLPTVTGAARNRLFSTSSTASMGDLRNALSKSYATLRQDLTAWEGSGLEQQTLFYDHARDLRDNVLALFAVQFIRNGRNFSTLSETSTRPRDRLLRQINDRLRHETEANMDAVVGATLACAVGTFVAVGLLYVIYVLIAPPASLDGMRFSTDIIATIAGDSASFALTAPAMCFVSSALALLIRDIRREQGKWRKWSLSSPPYARLLTTSIVPGLLGMAAVGAIMVIWEWGAGRITTQAQLAYFLQGMALYLVFFIPLATLVSIGVLMATDQHDELAARMTLRSTLMVAIPAFVVALSCVVFAVPNFSTGTSPFMRSLWTLRETLFLLAPMTIFLAAYALLLELSENPDATQEVQVT
ncbi:hypothetical protein Q4511_02670 [Paracoccus sp. 1_MG-2023]|uniref:hypothetical protein n=1 Tax=unclassified Paracoccus (in: a-proteobacteria) TaxID=2688777 RepID=UPI001C07FF16|nr:MULTISPECIES: hypothetical protein [unclassified Paracoccus (in: a-proteobacteria)]MBU2956138.1 hypothetical protein [Paracoccus sp. C2R09]MDO6667814.1 hypothetical protein [Paracoccus sp. 1_MG-2023]